QEPQINNYTAYKHTTGIYHRGRIANFNGTKFADNFTGTFITFTQRITNTLYVGHSRGNANPNDIVTGHTFYDGANTMAGNHFAGYTADNAHMFRAENAAQRLVHFAMSDTSFENDGSAGNVSFVNPSGFSSYNRVGQDMPAVIYDADGTFTGHVGGGAGSTIVPNNPFFYNSIDFRPAGWNAVVSDDLYAMFRMRSFSGNPLFRVTSPDGFSGQNRPGTGQFSGTNTLVKRDDGDYTLDFPEGLGGISNGFEVKYDTLVGPNQGSTIVRVAGVAQTVTINNAPRVQDVATLRNTNGVAFAVAGNDLWVKFSGNIEIDFVPGTNPPIDTPSEDQLVLGASDDAYIENGIGRNTTLLRVETAAGRTRTSYLKFDVPDTPGKDITDALLRLTVTGDPGTNLRLRIYQASNNTWPEAALNPANAPAKTVLLDQITGNWVIGQTYTFDVSDAVVAGEDVSFVIESDGNFSGGDTAFASSENTNVAIRPRLVVELEDAVSTSPVRVNSGAFDYENTQAVRLTFDADVDAADLADAITIRNLTRGTDVPGSEIDTAMNGRTATFTFDNMLANGNYRVTMPAGVALNDAGQMLENAFTMDFFVLAGDLDRDRDVDLTDAALLERNFGRTDDPLFSEGDLDYDGDVDLVDAALLERNFGTQPNSLLVAPPGLFSPVPLSQTRPTDTLFGNADNDQPGGRAFGGRVRDVVR
ncbi:MAG: DNRLRE domain-containing protein, partial [Planctomycetota bacterium]